MLTRRLDGSASYAALERCTSSLHHGQPARLRRRGPAHLNLEKQAGSLGYLPARVCARPCSSRRRLLLLERRTEQLERVQTGYIVHLQSAAPGRLRTRLKAQGGRRQEPISAKRLQAHWGARPSQKRPWERKFVLSDIRPRCGPRTWDGQRTFICDGRTGVDGPRFAVRRVAVSATPAMPRADAVLPAVASTDALLLTQGLAHVRRISDRDLASTRRCQSCGRHVVQSPSTVSGDVSCPRSQCSHPCVIKRWPVCVGASSSAAWLYIDTSHVTRLQSLAQIQSCRQAVVALRGLLQALPLPLYLSFSYIEH